MKERLLELFKTDKDTFDIIVELYLETEGIKDKFCLMDTLLDALPEDRQEAVAEILKGYNHDYRDIMNDSLKFDPSCPYFYRDVNGKLVSTSTKSYYGYLHDVVEHIYDLEYDSLPFAVQEIIS